MPTSSSTDDLLLRLRPFFDVAIHAGSDVMREVGSELTEKAAGGITSLGLRASGAVYRAIRNRFRTSKSKHALDKALSQASNQSEKEAAHRDFLNNDPVLRESLAALLERRDYLLSLQAFCEDLPISDLVPGNFRLSEVFIPPSLVSVQRETNSRSIAPEDLKPKLLSCGNSVIVGDVGSGKSSLARWLTSSIVDDLLSDDNAMSLDELRLPVYVTASSLQKTNWANALRNAVDQQLGIRGLSELSNPFFDTHSPLGHKRWIVLIDGFDELGDEEERSAIYRAISDIGQQDPDAFQFLAFARGTADELPLDRFDQWKLVPVQDPSQLVDRYLSDNQNRLRLKSLLSRPDYQEIARTPFFVAMSSALVASDAELPERPYDLVEAFIAYGIEASMPAEPSKQVAIADLLCQVALTPSSGIDLLLKNNREATSKLTSSSARLQTRRTIDRLLRNTGLVKISQNGSYQFIHKLIQQHLIARSLASNLEPNGAVWSKLDPGGLGWTSVEQLCIGWIETGKDAAPAIEALAEFGGEGLDAMLRISIQAQEIDDSAFEQAFQSLFDEIEEGITTSRDQLLSRLAATRVRVRQKLHSIVEHSWHGFELEPVARALSEAGYYNEIRSDLLEFVQEEDGDPHGQNEIASILLANGDRTIALATFLQSTKAADDWIRLDAACRYCRANPSAEAKRRLRDIVNEEYVEGDTYISAWLIEEVLDLGEVDLALPLLKEAAIYPGIVSKAEFLQFDGCVQAAKALGKYSPKEGLAALTELLSVSEISLRQQAEVLKCIYDLDPKHVPEVNLAELARQSPQQLDWFVIEALIQLRCIDSAWAATTELVAAQLQWAEITYSARGCLERVIAHVPQEEAEAYLTRALQSHPEPRLAAMFSIIGRSDLARAHLNAMLYDINPATGISAARHLSICGARAEGQAWLTKLARNPQAEAVTRVLAAKELQTVARPELAMIALRKLARSPHLDMKERCDSAEAFAEVSSGLNYSIIEILVDCAKSPSLTTASRLKALKSALIIDRNTDFFGIDPDRVFWGIVQIEYINTSDLSAICEVVALIDYHLSEFESVTTLLKDPSVETSIKLSALFNSNKNDLLARTILADLAADHETNLRDIERIVAHFWDDLPPSILAKATKVIADPMTPPYWRLKLAKSISSYHSSHTGTNFLNLISEDAGVDVTVRLDAFTSRSNDSGHTTFPDFSTLGDLTTHERVSVAKSALLAEHAEVAREHLELALQISPKSMHELVSLFDLAEQLDHTCTQSILDEIVSIPFEIMVHDSDTDSVLNAVAIGGRQDPAWALERLSTLVASNHVSVWSVPQIIDKMTTFIAEDVALGRVRPTLKKLVEELLEDPIGRNHFSSAVEAFYTRGWLSDPRPLIEHIENPNRRLSDRIGAAILLQKSKTASTKTVRELINSLLAVDPLNPGEALLAARELCRSGFRQDALYLGNRIRELPSLTSEQLLSLAQTLDDLGQGFKSKQIFDIIELKSLEGTWLSERDKKRLLERFGERAFTDFLRKKHKRPKDVIDRLQVAQELVNDFGDPDAIALIIETASDEGQDVTIRLEAIDLLDQLGYRQLPRILFETLDIETSDPLFAGAQCYRFGYNDRALRLFRKAIDNHLVGNRDWLLSNFAELRALEELERASNL